MQTLSKSFVLVAVVASALPIATANATIIAAWGFTTAVPAATTGVSYVYGAANDGESTTGTSLSSSHVVAATAYSSPSGNGSTYSLSSNNWTIGDYYEVRVSSAGYDGVSIAWDQTRSGTGPSTFELVCSIDGGASWVTLIASYAVVQAGLAGTNTTSWNAVTNQPTAFTNVAQAGEAGSNATLIFRIRSLVTTAAAGTNRIDNVVVSGNAVPAPGALALLGLAGLIGRRRR